VVASQLVWDVELAIRDKLRLPSGCGD